MASTYIGANLRYLRKLAGLSQQGLADQIGLNRGNIASYEKGAAEPSSINLLKITRFFQMDLIDFIERDLSDAHQMPLSAHTTAPKSPTGPVGDMYPDSQLQAGERSFLQVMQQRSVTMGRILEGFKAYNQHRTRTLKTEGQEVQWLILDYQRLLELSFELLDHNRQLIQRVATQEENPPTSATPDTSPQA